MLEFNLVLLRSSFRRKILMLKNKDIIPVTCLVKWIVLVLRQGFKFKDYGASNGAERLS